MGASSLVILRPGRRVLYSGFSAATVIGSLAKPGSAGPVFTVVQPCSRSSLVMSLPPRLPDFRAKPRAHQSGNAAASSPGVYRHRFNRQ